MATVAMKPASSGLEIAPRHDTAPKFTAREEQRLMADDVRAGLSVSIELASIVLLGLLLGIVSVLCTL